jgi:hypothetical protein
MNDFGKRFFKVLREQDDMDREAMEASLDQGTDPAAFDTAAPPNADANADASAVASAMAKQNAAMVSELRGWIDSIEIFLEKLNGTESSIQTVLAQADSDTLFDKMKQSEQRKIARVATELAALNESFKGFLATSTNASLRGV